LIIRAIFESKEGKCSIDEIESCINENKCHLSFSKDLKVNHIIKERFYLFVVFHKVLNKQFYLKDKILDSFKKVAFFEEVSNSKWKIDEEKFKKAEIHRLLLETN
jgi:hypothetical protein